MCVLGLFPGFKDRNMVLGTIWEVFFFFLRCTNPFSVCCDLSVLWFHQAVMYVACIHTWRLVLYNGINFEGWGPRLYPRVPCVGVGSTAGWLWPQPLYYGSVLCL